MPGRKRYGWRWTMPGAGLSESTRRGCEPWLFLVSGERRAAGPQLCLAGGWSAVRDSDGQFFDARTDRGEAAGDQGGLRPVWRPWARATASARRACGSETSHCRLPGNISTKLGAPSSQIKMQTNRISNLRDQFDRGPSYRTAPGRADDKIQVHDLPKHPHRKVAGFVHRLCRSRSLHRRKI